MNQPIIQARRLGFFRWQAYVTLHNGEVTLGPFWTRHKAIEALRKITG